MFAVSLFIALSNYNDVYIFSLSKKSIVVKHIWIDLSKQIFDYFHIYLLATLVLTHRINWHHQLVQGLIHLMNWRFCRITMSLNIPFVPKSDVKLWFPTTTITVHIIWKYIIHIHNFVNENHSYFFCSDIAFRNVLGTLYMQLWIIFIINIVAGSTVCYQEIVITVIDLGSTLYNPFKPEFTIVIFIHYKPRIAVAILDL